MNGRFELRTSSSELLSDLLEHQAESIGDHIALTDGSNSLTWADYRDRVGRLANALADSGITPGERVAVHLAKSLDAFVAVHAVLRLGAVMVPIDWFASPGYVNRLLEDAEVAAVISGATDDRLRALTDSPTVRAVVDPALIDPSGVVAPITRCDPSDAAYIIYTSGSTGTPKGIVHTHASGLAYARRAAALYELTERDRLANIAPLHFDQSTFELYSAPAVGATTIVVPDPVLRFPASLSDLLSRTRATVLYTVPYVVSQLVARGALDDKDLSSLRWVLFGGEVFVPALLGEAMRKLPTARFSNVYGPAEVNQCTFHHIDVPPLDNGPIPIGHAWENTELLIVDGDEPVAPGEAGELLVSTDTMMQCYFKQPQLTDASITERTADGVTRRWYRTGDLVRIGEHGLVFLGRIDHQVKIRGYRIELEAVESALGEDPNVEACAAVVDGDRLVAVVSPPLTPSAQVALHDRLRNELPPHAVPSQIVGWTSLPRTGTGKIDRRAVVDELGRRPSDTDQLSAR